MSEEPSLAEMTCVPCRGGTPALAPAERQELLHRLGAGWRIVDGHHLEKEFAFRNWKGAMAFANLVGEVAEQQGHHPDLLVSWGRVTVTLFTHAIDGLHRNDFILAARIEALPGAGGPAARGPGTADGSPPASPA
jgi:4a-hydroxytetrahydrobiopterin dehydratase